MPLEAGAGDAGLGSRWAGSRGLVGGGHGLSGLVRRGNEPIAGLRHGLDEPRVGGRVAELAAQVRDVDVHDPLEHVVGPAGHRVEQLLAGHDDPRPSSQGQEEARLAGGEPTGPLPRHGVVACGGVKGQSAAVERQDGGGGQVRGAERAVRRERADAAEDGGHPRGDLVRVERLAQVVVGAEAETGDAVRIGSFGGGDEDRHRAAVAELLEDGLALHPRKHEVEDHEVSALGVERGEGRGAIGGLGDHVPVALQVETEQGADLRLVLDDEDAGPDLAVGSRCGPVHRSDAIGQPIQEL